MTTESGVDRVRRQALAARERATFADRNPESAAAYAGAGHLFGQVPMTCSATTRCSRPR
ncbi:hypothetical protein ACIA5C_07890 [Actinoplanes sp. NPDC051343]|uniref:hypothetical protein n=1 Tax=Actinoplanes sp. NPDC051343 TaxID=3363906 RepID=UPI0037AFE745